MPHRSHEWPGTLAQLLLAFGDPHFAVHEPVPPAFGDEGAANHMRLTPAHGEPGIELFVYGVSGGAFPGAPAYRASRAIARLHRLDPDRTLFVEQSEVAIAAGAFHNDVVAVANGPVLFAHEQAFANRAAVIAACERAGSPAWSWSRSPKQKCRWWTRSLPICSTRSSSPFRAARRY
jgi:succinylarginine dihydrolase